MRMTLKSLAGVAAFGLATHAAGQITLYQNEGFRGPVFAADRSIANFDRTGFNDRASSAVVERGAWQVCEDARFQGRCVVLRPGNYPSLSAMGLNDRISSVRPVSGKGYVYAPPAEPVPVYEYRQRPNEHLYQVPVTYVRAVVGPPEQRCWARTAAGAGKSRRRECARSDRRRRDRRRARSSGWRRTRPGHRHCRWRGRRRGSRRQRRPGGGATDVNAERATLRDGSERRTAGLLGCRL